ncbi:MAG: ribonuclease HI [Flavobacteriales bacterium]
MNIIIYTDGAASGNPGPGGYGALLMTPDKKHYKELFDGFRATTNNRMELLAVIVALEKIKATKANVVIYSDSKYVVDAVEKGWLFTWEKTGFNKKKNADLWRRFLQVYKLHKVKFIWVKGHNGNQYNERCDELAVAAYNLPNLKIDEGYESTQHNDDLFSD